VLDTTVLVSAFLRPVAGGASFEVLRFAREGKFELFLSAAILDEVADTLLTHERLRRRYRYPDAAVEEYCHGLGRFCGTIGETPQISIVRDPDDDKILACAIACDADYLVTRDKDLLSLDVHAGIRMLPPEEFLQCIRAAR
jgi:putative PIN family toxin of toxin-antitoxin system